MYHITINTEHGIPLLGQLVGTTVEVNGLGKMVRDTLLQLPVSYSGLKADCFEVMPNHLHVLFLLDGLEPERPDMRRVIQRLKSITGLTYVRWRNSKGLDHLPAKLWKRSFRDTYIKSERQLEAVRNYIKNNPLKAALDARDKV